MQSPPPDPDGLDSSWDEEDEEAAGESTRRIDSKELFERAGFPMEEELAGEERGGAEGEASAPKRSGGRTTRRQPQTPPAEHRGFGRAAVSQQSPTVPRMRAPWAQPEVGETFEDTLDSLLEERSLPLECDEPGTASTPGPTGVRPTRRVPAVPGQMLAEDDLFDGLDAPTLPGGGAPTAPPSRPRASAAPGEVDLGLDFDLPDLDVDAPPAATSEPGSAPPGTVPPITPPPGTLRYGLIEDEDSFNSTIPPGWSDRLPPPPAGTRPMLPKDRPSSSSPTPVSTAAPARSAAGPRRTESVRMATLIPGMAPDVPLVPAPAPAPAPLPAPPPSSSGAPDDRRRQMLQRYESGDYGGALVLAEALLDEIPDDPTARRYADGCTEMLRQMYKARIGDGSQVLRIVMSGEELRSLNLDHRAGFLLSCIDGMSSIDDILDVSGMRELEALRILFELVQENVIAPSDR